MRIGHVYQKLKIIELFKNKKKNKKNKKKYKKQMKTLNVRIDKIEK